MSSTTLPPRTRSIRKPAERATRQERPRSLVLSAAELDPTIQPSSTNRTSQSPSRLPTVKQRSSTISAGRPPSASSVVSGNGSMRPPPPRASISKPANEGLSRTSSNRYPVATEPAKEDRSRPPIVTRHLRNASASNLPASRVSGHARTKSSSTLLSTSTALRPRTLLPEDQLRTSQADPQIRKPAFSTLQQHFSPAKNLAPKPHPAVFLAPPSPSKLPSNIAISVETAKLQSELLQFHLIHKGATRVQAEWKASAKSKLGSKFQSVVVQHRDLVQLEVNETGKINATALKDWQDVGVPGWGLDEKIQVLDEVLSGVWNLGEPGGKYARVVRRFERWLSRCQDILQSRAKNEEDEGEEPVFIEKLDMAWKDDCLVLARKLESSRDQLKDLEMPEGSSSLASIMTGCRSLVLGMLAEISIMAQIERDAIQSEVDWIRCMSTLDDSDNKSVAGAAWRR